MSGSLDLLRVNVAVLAGGASGEREVSLKSGAAVARALRANTDGRGPARVDEIECERDGAWRFEGVLCEPTRVVERLGPDTLYFLGLHGGAGEDGTLQGFLRTSRRAHTGSGVAASALCMNKSATRALLRDAGVRVAQALEFDVLTWGSRHASTIDRLLSISALGWVVKPRSGGSSVATSIVLRASDLPAAIERALSTGDAALVEERIVGREATCGILGNARDELRALPVVEIVPKEGRFFDYEEKYSASGAGEFCPPRSISPATCERIQTLALVGHRTALCDGYSRIDFMVPLDANGREGEPVALEINTLPGMTDRSLLPQAAAAAGFSFRDLCLEIVALALRKTTR